MCIDLVFSYSIDATNCLFTESDALRSRFFPPDPLTAGAAMATRTGAAVAATAASEAAIECNGAAVASYADVVRGKRQSPRLASMSSGPG